MKQQNYIEKKSNDGLQLRVFKTTDEAWDALTPQMRNSGWRICCAGGYENAIIKYEN